MINAVRTSFLSSFLAFTSMLAAFPMGPDLTALDTKEGDLSGIDREKITHQLAQMSLNFHKANQGGGYSVSNTWQNYDAKINGSSCRLDLYEQGHWVGFDLAGTTRNGERNTFIQRCEASINNSELTVPFADLDIQWQNSALGLRQNFIVHERANGKGEARILIELQGDLIPCLSDTKELNFVDHLGKVMMTYKDLKVWDARGRILPAHMELVDKNETSILALAFDDRDAVYPITVDPISVTPNRLLIGTQVSAEFGISVSTAGDLNGDGYSEVVVGAWKGSMGESGEGIAYVYYGGPGGISATPSVVLQSDQVNAQFGCAVHTAGDVNGDGYSDLMVGARTWESSGSEATEGAVFIFHGSATGIGTVPDVILQTNHAGDAFGSNVAPAGDVNGDGYSDIVVGAYLAEYPTNQEGAAFIFHGSPTGLNPAFAHRLEINQNGAHFGRSVGGAGDINGDGFSDVIVGAARYDLFGVNDGSAYIYYGSPASFGGLYPAPSQTLGSDGQGDARFGWSVTTAGDVNGDGFSDVAVGAYNNYNSSQTQEGFIYVFHGSGAGLNTTPAIVLESNQAFAWMGRSISTAGDMNGDGYSDLLVGLPRYANGESQEGVGRLYLGTPTGVTSNFIQFELNDPGANLGESVGIAGDVNGDGYSDMILGARIYGLGGAAAVYHGGPFNMNLSPTLSINGAALGNELGRSVAHAGDVNGDGYSDVIVGAPMASNGQPNEGQAYVHLGSANGIITAPHRVLESNVTGMLFGRAVSTAGDVNGDGYSDVIVGAPGANSGAGRVYVYMGSPAGLALTPALFIDGTAGSGAGSALSTAGDVNVDGYSDVVIGCNNVGGRVTVHLGSPTGLITSPQLVLTGSGGYGSTVSSAGDVNGDGASDIIIGAPTSGANGSVFIYHGEGMTGITPTPALQINGPMAGAQFGYSVSGAEDVNGDGFSDVIIGAPFWNNGQLEEGAAFVHFGSTTGILSAPGSTLQTNVPGGHTGSSVSGCGDINGDGYADVVVGSPDLNMGQLNEGVAGVYRGGIFGVNIVPDALETNLVDQHLGTSVAGAGDVDGDGYSDVIVGAPNASTTNLNEGSYSVFHGNLDENLVRRTRQYQSNLITPLSVNSQDFSNITYFGIGQFARSHIHRSDARLRWEVVFEGQPFSGVPITNSTASTGTGAVWSDLGSSGVELKQLILKNTVNIRYKWRVRVEQHPAHMIDGQRYGRWFYGYASGRADIGVLPIELIHFGGDAEAHANRLFWTTVTEKNSDHFIVERSSNGHEFQNIGSVEAAGDHIGSLDYGFLDQDPLPAISYYRLKMIDRDGAFEHSEMISIVRADQGPSLYPVPVIDELNVVLPMGALAASFEVIDVTGRVVLEQNIVDPTIQAHRIGMAQIPSGQYTITVRDAAGSPLSHTPFVK